MKVMIVTESKADREILSRYLGERAHAVQAAASGGEANLVIDERSCDVALIDWVTSRCSSLDLIRRLRERDAESHVYTIVIMSNPTPASVSAAFAAGADDLLRRPFVREELIARVETVDRIRRWAVKVLGDVALRSGDLARLKTWKGANRTIGTELSDFLDRSLEVRAPAPGGERRVAVAEVPLSVVEEGIECRLRVGMGAASLEGIGRILLGGGRATKEDLADMVREMANVAGGALVTAADAEGVALTLGVPYDAEPERDWTETTGTVQEFVLGLAGVPLEFSVRISTRSRALRELALGDLCAGMTVARPITTADGTVLAPAGASLTASTVAVIRGAMSPNVRVTVLAGAGASDEGASSAA